MPIFVGSTEINEIQLGSNAPFESVFIGSDKVFSRPRLYDVTVAFWGIASQNNGHGYYASSSNGSISNPQNQPSTSWFNPATDVAALYWSEYINTNTGIFYVRLNNYGVANNDSTFKSVKVNNTVFNRADADYYFDSGVSSNAVTLWGWDINTNPWSGTGNTDRVRFDKP